jgi:Na+-driven multidrug efflux pump
MISKIIIAFLMLISISLVIMKTQQFGKEKFEKLKQDTLIIILKTLSYLLAVQVSLFGKHLKKICFLCRFLTME